MSGAPEPFDELIQQAVADPDEILRQLDKVDAERRFADFVRVMWPVIEPATVLKWGRALDMMCEALEAIHRGDIRRLLLNVPPGFSKSTLCSVLFPAWEWGPRNMPHLRYVCVSYVDDLALRDNVKCRRVLVSEPYQRNWGDRVTLVGDQNQKGSYQNDATGFREAGGIKSGTMGKRGDRVILDDPNDTKKADSEAALNDTQQFMAETLATRYNDERSATIIVQQRTHERDASGHVLAHELGYTHVMLPMRFEPHRRCIVDLGGGHVLEDPRTDEGELLFPELFPLSRVEEIEKDMRSYSGEYAVAGQLQQRPIPRGGGMFKREWFKEWEGSYPVGRFVRGWDLAGTKGKTSPFTVGVLGCLTINDELVIVDVIRDRWEAADLVPRIVEVAVADGHSVEQSLPQDPGQAGKFQIAAIVKALHGYTVHSSPESGSKETRAGPLASQAKHGNVYLMPGAWNAPFTAELGVFPRGAYKDQADGASRMYARLVQQPVEDEWVGGMLVEGV